MTNAQRLKLLTNTDKTTFSLGELRNIWDTNYQTARVAAKRMVKEGLLIKLAKGYYALDKDFNIYELANLVVSPSYISFNSALFYHGISFQVSNIISSVALFNYQRKIGGYALKYYSMKESLFFNLEGINYKKNLAIASPERAVLDSFYFDLLPNIDNWEKLNLTYLRKLSLIYPKTIRKKLENLVKKSK